MLAVVPVRDGALPAGAAETVAECGYNALVIGDRAGAAAALLGGTVIVCEAGAFRAARWARALAAVVHGERIVVLPASPDGRDLAPRLAAVLDRPLFAGAMSVLPDTITVALGGGTAMSTMAMPATCIATLQVGVRGVDLALPELELRPVELDLDLDGDLDRASGKADAEVLSIVPPDAATIDLAEAPRIVAGGAGLGSPEQFEQLARLGRRLGASVGATRVITDRGWVGHERQIGTTGVVVDPRLYMAFGISGAVQHTSGLGTPDHIISINTDAYCPMMQLADLAVVADANEVLDHLLDLLGTGDG